MPGIASYADLVRCYDEGRVHLQCGRKVSPLIGMQGTWTDVGMWPGDPRPNYYATTPLTAVAMRGSTHGGIYSGPPVGSARKHLHRLTMWVTTTNYMPVFPAVVADYLLYYPFIDEAIVDEEQVMSNPVALPRYTDGEGLRMMAVVAEGHSGNPATITVRYTNSKGVANRTSQPLTLGSWQGQTANFAPGMLLGSQYGNGVPLAGCRAPYIDLQPGDTGIRSVDGVTVGNGGDIGLFTIILVRPLVQVTIREPNTAASEVDYFRERAAMPRIFDDCCLNYFGVTYTSSAFYQSNIYTAATFVWS